MIGYRNWLRLQDYAGDTLEEKLRSFVDILFSDKSYLRELQREMRRCLEKKKRNGRHVFAGKRRKELKFNHKKIMREIVP